MSQAKKFRVPWLLVGVLVSAHPAATSPGNALVNVSYFSASSNRTVVDECECGLYGLNSPMAAAQGLVVTPKSANLQACSQTTEFTAPGMPLPWIALIERGNCTFSEKINIAASRGAAAVVIYNTPPGSGNQTIPMLHYGTDNTVAIMIGNDKGREILNLIQRGIQVTMVIEVAKKHGAWMNHYSIFFVSVSFFIVTAATVGYFIFYSARRLRLSRAQNRKLKKLKADAKKAIGQLQLRTLKQGDVEASPDGDSCAVCIDNYKPNDVVRILTCNHFFHRACIDPWLLEHRTCPMCKCDILKALGIEVDVEAAPADTTSDLASNATPPVTVSPTSVASTPAWTEEDERSETASSGYASVRGMDEIAAKDESASGQNTGDDNEQLVKHEPNTLEVDVLPHMDNPSFEDEESQRRELKS
ncbi:E3 ubiquitin-protein ligase RNF128 isoform X1 [Lissotriton helveticus]